MSGSILEKATSALGEVAKTDVLKDAVDNVVSRGIDGAKSLLHNLEENKGQVSSKIVGAVSQFAGGSADSSATTTADRDLPMSTDNQVGIKNTHIYWNKIRLGGRDRESYACFF